MCLSQLLDPGPRVGEPGPHERCAGARGSPEVGGQAGSQLQVGVCRRWMRPCSKVSNSAPGANQASAGSSRAEASGVQPGGPGSRGPCQGGSHGGPETGWGWSLAFLPHSHQGSGLSDPTPAPGLRFQLNF